MLPVTRTAWLLGGAAIAVLLALPAVLSSYAVTVFIFIFFYGYLGQAWNILGGYGGQLSAGHAAFVGVGAYATTLLSMHWGLSPWIGMALGGVLAAGLGAIVGGLGFRFGLRGFYFVLLTVAFAEVCRIVALNTDAMGGAFYANYLFSLQPNAVFGIPLSVDIIIRPVVGGAGTLLGPLVGSLILSPLAELARIYFSRPGWTGLHLVVYGALLIGVVLFLPQGAYPYVRRAWARRRPEDA